MLSFIPSDTGFTSEKYALQETAHGVALGLQKNNTDGVN